MRKHHATLAFWNVTLLLINGVRGNEVCYDRLGCFTNDAPWSGTLLRPISKLPWSPEKINTRFLLYTRENTNNFQEIKATSPETISQSNFDASKITRFITHGFVDKGEEDWLSDMCKSMFQVEDVNCICIDWKGGSRCPYTQAANNIRVIGAEVAYFIDVLMAQYGYSPSMVHIIGHSLGAHLAGEAGKRRPGIGRITGLDPAQPYFQGTPVEVRLDKSDALFVDVIHTDMLPTIPYMGFGMSDPVGHLDFFPNGGETMPGCSKNPISQIVDIDGIWEGALDDMITSSVCKYDLAASAAGPCTWVLFQGERWGTRDFVACNHLRSYKYYADSILYPDGFLGYQCSTYSEFESGDGFPCPNGGCPKMGHYADQYKDRATSGFTQLYLNTADARLFARWRYKVSITLSGNSNVRGYINIALYGSGGNTKQYQIFQGTLQPGSSYTSFTDVEINVGTVDRVKFLWNNNAVNPSLPKLGASRVQVQDGEYGHTGKLQPSKSYTELIDVEIDVGSVNKVKFLWNNNIINPTLPRLGAAKITVQDGKDGNVYNFCGSETVREEVLQTLTPC